jgi:hypothetical protein
MKIAAPQNPSVGLVKIIFDLEPDAWHGSSTEALWAEKLEHASYRIVNTPFYVKGVSFGDVVKVKTTEHGLLYCETTIRGGHSTYRIIVVNIDCFEKYWQALRKFGCTYEENQTLDLPMFAVDVPPRANLDGIFQLLTDGETADVWSFEEGHCARNTS